MTDTEKSETITFPIQIDNVRYLDKDTAKKAIGGIKTRLSIATPQMVSVEQLAQIVMQGKSVQPGILKGGAKAENWVKQQIFGIDLDNEKKGSKPKRIAENPLTVDSILDRCKKHNLTPILIYKTLSSRPEWERFRVLFLCDKIITDTTERDSIQKSLMYVFPECDSTCKNADRFFLGGLEHGVCFSSECTFSPEEFLKLYDEQFPPEKTKPADDTKKAKAQFKTNYSKSPYLREAVKNFDFLGYIRNTSSDVAGSEHNTGKRIDFYICPICGGNQHFSFYKDTNKYKCFSDTCTTRGSIIDFLQATENLDTKEAIQRFYEISGNSEQQLKRKFESKKAKEKAKEENLPLDENGELPPFIEWKVNNRTFEVTFSVNCPQLAKYIRENEHFICVNDRFSKEPRIFWYENGAYKPANDYQIQGHIKKYITDFNEDLLKMSDVREVLQILKTDLNFISDTDLNADENIINFQNGIYYISEQALKPHSPDIYSTIQIPCNYNPDNKNSPTFDRFLNELTEGNTEKQELLLEFMGIAISNIRGYRMKRALFMFGEGNTGKSQLKQLTERLIGSGNYSNCDLTQLEERFGFSNLYLKRLSGSSDMGFVSVSELRIFKQATGGDDILCEFKHNNAFSFKYTGLLWFCTNELPSFGGDRGKWVYERIIPLECRNVIPKERQDKQLVEKLFAEREAIINKLIPAIERVIANGYNFTIPEECKAKLSEYQRTNSPVISFVEECCTTDFDRRSDDTMKPDEVYRIFKMWYADNYGSGKCCSKRNFNKELANFYNVSDVNQMMYRTNNCRYYPFIVKEDVKKLYYY